MYAQFRAQYPMGSLISELLNIHEGKYIVRASIQVGGTTLATGLSAAITIEQAEDQARVRALVVLGIEGHPYTTRAQIVNPDLEEVARSRARLASTAHTAEFLSITEAPFQNALDLDWVSSNQSQAFQSPPQSWFDHNLELGPESRDDSGHSRKEPLPSPFNAPSASVSTSVSAPFSHRSQPQLRESVRDMGSSIGAPTDLSDIIAHTDVELKRLGWTNAQGRRYLEKTYSKRSRQHLSDAELMEFLDYLKTQPAPGKSLL